MSRRILNLSVFPWQFGRVKRQRFSAQPVDDRGSVAEWLPARVPGDVRADLIAAGRIPPVETPEGIAAGAWVDDYDWWYRVELPGDLAATRSPSWKPTASTTYSAIWLDGQRLATHAGMFSRQSIVLAAWINTPGAARAGDPRLGRRRAAQAAESALASGHPLAGRQGQPGHRVLPRPDGDAQGAVLLRLGLRAAAAQHRHLGRYPAGHRPRRVHRGSVGAGRAADRGAEESEERKGSGGEVLSEELRRRRDSDVPAQFQVRLRGRCWQAGALRAEVTIAPEGFSAPSVQETLDLDLNLNLSLNLSLDLPSARLWWPWDQGEPNLYRVTVRLLDDAGVLDEIEPGRWACAR